MIFNFSAPAYLLLLPVCFVVTIFFMRIYPKKNRLKKNVITVLRLFVLTLLVLSLSDMSFKKYTDKTTTIFLADMSDSMTGAKDSAASFINEALKHKTKNDTAGVVVFGEKALVEKNPANELNVIALDSNVAKGFTNISDGLRLAHSLMSEDEKKRIVLISDGEENVDSALKAAKMLDNADVSIEVFSLGGKVTDEVQLEQISVPEYVEKNMSYDIEAVISSLVSTRAKLVLYKDGTVISNEEITVREGENRIILKDVANNGGGVIFKGEIQPVMDTFYENNTAYAYSYVSDIPDVLVLNRGNSGQEIENILKYSEVAVTSIDSRAAPLEADKLNLYDAVILCDVSIDDLNDEFPGLLLNYVKNSGGGVLVTGGENSYALGGYLATDLETLLPVEMELKDKKNVPDLGLVIILDRSGSMSDGGFGVSKLELAKEAAIRSAETVTEKDYIGILTFDDAFSWAVPFQKAGNDRSGITEKTASISAGGGTSILPALEEGCAELKAANTKLKHIILLTDGQAEQTGYDRLIASMKNDNITLSTVAVGRDADINLLKKLSEDGGGRYYFTDEFSDLPKIFARETVMAGESYINNRTFFPKIYDVTPILNGIEYVPEIGGYIAASEKTRADVLLRSDKDDPILAAWQYGLGRSVAFTTDLDKWTANFFNTDEGVRILRNAVSWILRKQLNTELDVSITPKGKTSDININIPYSEDIKSIFATVQSDKESFEINLNRITPNEYAGEIDTAAQGTYIVNLQIEKETGTDLVTRGVSIPYSREYDIKYKNNGVLNSIAALPNVKIISSPEEVFQALDAKVYFEENLTDVLLALALLIFMIDIAARRFPAIINKLELVILKKPIKNSSEKVYNDRHIEKQAMELTNPNTNSNAKRSENISELLVSRKKKRLGR